jgi:hypothetical protein
MTDYQPESPAFTEAVAQMFHEKYEELAPRYLGDHVAVPWSKVPKEHRELLTATVGEIMAFLGRGGSVTVGGMPSWMEPHKPQPKDQGGHRPSGPEAIQQAPMEIPPVITIEPED